uniref:Putative secreted protein n=1 Tax=Ixodes ricinus TaxID=34613 RepID=A0A6B0UZD7_IXORI
MCSKRLFSLSFFFILFLFCFKPSVFTRGVVPRCPLCSAPNLRECQEQLERPLLAGVGTVRTRLGGDQAGLSGLRQVPGVFLDAGHRVLEGQCEEISDSLRHARGEALHVVAFVRRHESLEDASVADRTVCEVVARLDTGKELFHRGVGGPFCPAEALGLRGEGPASKESCGREPHFGAS